MLTYNRINWINKYPFKNVTQASSPACKKFGSRNSALTRSEKLNNSSYVSKGRGVTGPSAATRFADRDTEDPNSQSRNRELTPLQGRIPGGKPWTDSSGHVWDSTSPGEACRWQDFTLVWVLPSGALPSGVSQWISEKSLPLLLERGSYLEHTRALFFLKRPTLRRNYLARS